MMLRGFSVKLLIKLKSQVRKKNTHGLNLLGPTVEKKTEEGRWGLLTLGPWPDRWIGKAGRRICAAGPSAVQGSGWAEAEEAQARAVAGLARSTGRAGELLVLCSMQSCGRLLVQSSGERGERAARQTVTGAELHLAPARDKNGAGSRRGSGLGWRSATREGGRRIHRTGTRQGAPWMSRGVCVRRCGEAEPDGGVSTAEGEAGGVRNGWVRPGTGRRRAVGHGDDTAGQEEEHGTGARALRDEGRRRAEPGARRCSPARAWPGSGGP